MGEIFVSLGESIIDGVYWVFIFLKFLFKKIIKIYR